MSQDPSSLHQIKGNTTKDFKECCFICSNRNAHFCFSFSDHARDKHLYHVAFTPQNWCEDEERLVSVPPYAVSLHGMLTQIIGLDS